jgi:hypothetical protein
VRSVSCLYSIAILLSASFAFAQMNTGEISGHVQDPSGSVLPGAVVTANQMETNRTFTGTTNNSGEFLFAQLPVGTYLLSAAATDFKQSTLPRIEVHAGDRLRFDFTLRWNLATGPRSLPSAMTAARYNLSRLRSRTSSDSGR